MRQILYRLTDRLCQRLILQLERHLGVPDGLAHLRWIVRVARPVAFKLVTVARVAAYRRSLPAEAFFAASLTAVASEGCGHCLEMGRRAAIRASLAPATVEAIVRGDDHALPAPLRAIRRFVQAVIAHDDAEAGAQRAQLRNHFGDAGLAEVIAAMATARVLPTVRRAAGFAAACTLTAPPPDGTDTRARHAVQ